MVSKKDRRNSGRRMPHITVNKKDIINNDLVIDIYWDDWVDYRDGLRYNKDNTLIRNSKKDLVDKFNKKNKLLNKRRAAKKFINSRNNYI